ncbi:MAG: capsular exopolysaccharide family [Bryobacterales bacterium]|nr:capsular exopolysaccharide family [Bryobacterales bacterium]
MKQLIPAENNVQANLAILSEIYSAASQTRESKVEQGSVPLSRYLFIIRRNRWPILAFVMASLLTTFVVSRRITPMYESATAIDIDRQSPSAVIGQDSTSRSALNDADQFLATQMKLVLSDAVLRPVAEKYELLHLERQFGVASERSRRAASNAPILLKQLKVTRPPNTYLLMINYRSPDPQLSADVSNAVADSYLRHIYEIRYNSSASLSTYMEKQLEELRAKMERSSGAMAEFERQLNVIDPTEKTNILSARLLQLNTDYTNSQGDRVKKEAAYESVKNGSIEAAQVSLQGESLRRLSERLSDAQEKYAEIEARFGANHPENRRAAAQIAEIEQNIQRTKDKIAQRAEVEYSEALNRENMMRRAVTQVKGEFDRLNARSFEYQSAKREAEADKKLYEELVRKIKEATINTSFQNSSIRIADLARPAFLPVSPNIPLNMAAAFFCSLLLATTCCILFDVLDDTVRDPEQITLGMNSVLLGSLPSVRNWKSRIAGGGGKTSSLSLSLAAPEADEFREAVRTLRNSILLADFDRSLRSILITSSSASEGKSTSASHLAIAHAEQGKRTLLIDGDLRRPNLHKRFGVTASKGLADVLERDEEWKGCVVKLEAFPFLDILPAGHATRCAPELIGRGIGKVIEECTGEYDLVILDGPPAIGFAEPLQVATAVDGVIIVTRAGQTQQKAVASLIATMKRLRINIVGVVMNQVNRDVTDNYYYYGTYGGKYGKYSQLEK